MLILQKKLPKVFLAAGLQCSNANILLNKLSEETKNLFINYMNYQKILQFRK